MLALSLIMFYSANAQGNLSENQKSFKSLKNKELTTVSIPNLKITEFGKQRSKVSFNFTNSGVYTLPLDNMPCLVTKINSDMPVAKNFPQTNIPNVLKENKSNQVSFLSPSVEE